MNGLKLTKYSSCLETINLKTAKETLTISGFVHREYKIQGLEILAPGI